MRMGSPSFLEKLRLQDLYKYGILDSGAEEEFENLVDLSKSILKCPIAAISFIDEDRVYFKAERGLNVDEISRDIAFCNHTIKHDRVLVIKDVTKDRRFDKNPLVYGEPGIRFYAGAPIHTHAGFKIGSVCLIDTKPRQFSVQCRNALDQISRQIGRLLELRLENRVLKLEAEKAVRRQISLFHQTVQRQEEQNFLASNELHEHIAQDIAAARLYLDSASLAPDQDFLAESKNNLARVIERTKGLSIKMFPSTFRSSGLGGMVQDLANRFAAETGIEVSLYAGELDSMQKDQRIILFRIIEEQFRNIQQHSCATKVVVRIDLSEQVVVQVVDNGIGLRESGDGYGIKKMISLTEYYGGSLEFFEPSERGCGLRVSMPVGR